MFNLTQAQQSEWLEGRNDARRGNMPQSSSEHYIKGYRRQFDIEAAKISGIDSEGLFNSVVRGNV